jgi:hypothetical protein
VQEYCCPPFKNARDQPQKHDRVELPNEDMKAVSTDGDARSRRWKAQQLDIIIDDTPDVSL